jgi:hypothetical protein
MEEIGTDLGVPGSNFDISPAIGLGFGFCARVSLGSGGSCLRHQAREEEGG